MECRAIGRRCATGSATILGDLAQGTTPAAAANWHEVLAHLGKPGSGVRILGTGYRVPREILDFASRLLPHLATGLVPARSLREDAGALAIVRATERSMPGLLVDACGHALKGPGSVAVIAADGQVAAVSQFLRQAGVDHGLLEGPAVASRLTVVPVTLAKGLEFDQVIVVEPARIAAAEWRGLHRLYVALTRAVSRLTVIHAGELPHALR